MKRAHPGALTLEEIRGIQTIPEPGAAAVASLTAGGLLTRRRRRRPRVGLQ